MDGLRLALSWLTVLPVRAPTTVDRRVAARAIRWAPLAGLLLGMVAAGLLYALIWLTVPPFVAGLLVVTLLALGSRGMHLDGLADTADGLGCYGPPERALAVMRSGAAGPFAVVALIIVIGLQAAAFARLGTDPTRWAAVPLALVTGRCAFSWCCRRGVPAARPEGMGALVASSQPWAIAVLSWLALAAVALFVVPGKRWLGPLAVLLAALLVIALSAHTRRRFGGITGDVLGAAAELATTAALVTAAIG